MNRHWASIASAMVALLLAPVPALAQRVCPWVMQMQQQQYQMQMHQQHAHHMQMQQAHYHYQMSQVMQAQAHAHRYAPPPPVHHHAAPQPPAVARHVPAREVHIKPPAIMIPRLSVSLHTTRHMPAWKPGHGPGGPAVFKPPHETHKLKWEITWARHQPAPIRFTIPGTHVEKAPKLAKHEHNEPKPAAGPKLLLPEISHNTKAKVTASKTTASKTVLTDDELKVGLKLIKVDFSCAKCHQHGPSQPTAVAKQPAPAMPLAVQPGLPKAVGQPKPQQACARPEPARPMHLKAPEPDRPMAQHKLGGDAPRVVRQAEAPKLAKAARPPLGANGDPMPMREVRPSVAMPRAFAAAPAPVRQPMGAPALPAGSVAMLLPAAEGLPRVLQNGTAVDAAPLLPQKALKKSTPMPSSSPATSTPSTMPLAVTGSPGGGLLLPEPGLAKAIRVVDRSSDTADEVQQMSNSVTATPVSELDGPALPPLARATLVLGAAPPRTWDMPAEDE
jgi:hypothetical protein